MRMVSKNDLKIIEVYELFGEKRYRVCVQGTNIFVNVEASSEEEALKKSLQILASANLDQASLERIRALVAQKAKC